MDLGVTVKNLPFKVGHTMTVVGIPDLDSSRFDINIGTDEFTTIGLHISVRFDSVGDHNTVVCNTFQHHQWGQEVRERSFPFCQGQEFKVIVDFTPTQFVVTLSDGSTINFPNRFCAKEYSVMDLEGKVRFTSLQIK
ncbi:beta-galactoside-binding lectin-like [Salarias fasciatus]|uniref:beta-galactoside-binding lectin-like n=1 Tax=Salarias fasciatus TaxID=181472 RepID=UPI001176A74E|nr:beta-galactoside-binding lectin-like [Salarias fasciatus]